MMHCIFGLISLPDLLSAHIIPILVRARHIASKYFSNRSYSQKFRSSSVKRRSLSDIGSGTIATSPAQ
jgi:hypothetical protein